MELTSHQRQRAVGAVLGMACGDALGAPYEFGPPIPHDTPIGMVGGGHFDWEPGEWTDDTSMAIPILQQLAAGADLLDPATRDRVAADWFAWSRDAPDVGNLTRLMLRGETIGAAELTDRAEAHYRAGNNAAGNGTLMRTTPITLGYLHDPDGLTRAATEYALLTHGDPRGAQACVLWTHAQRRAILTGGLDITAGLDQLERDDRAYWVERIAEAEAASPEDLHLRNGWVVAAFQAAWSAISTTEAEGPQHFVAALERAVRGGGDADTVGAIAGGLLGAAWGVTAIPARWRRKLHGWPEWSGQDLVNAAVMALAGGGSEGRWPLVDRMPCDHDTALVVRHPQDPGVWLGDLRGLDALPESVTAVVSLCRLGREQYPAPGVKPEDHVVVWILDEADPAANPDLATVLCDTVQAIRELREEGKDVYLHCVHAHSRTPTVAAIYAAEAFDADPRDALDSIGSALGGLQLNARFQRVVQEWDVGTCGGA